MSNKFAKFNNNIFDDVRNKLQQKREEHEKRNTNQGFDDSWKFKPALPKKASKINYRVRVLPNVHSEIGEPWLLGLYHMYRKSTGKFIYTLCPTTFDKKNPCPFCEEAAALFSTKDKVDEGEARKVYKKKRYFVNVLVVKDERQGEENQQGKVLVWEFGSQIFDKFADAIEQKVNFFHPVDGRDFNLSIKAKGEYPDYSMSSFAVEPTPISKSDEECNKIFDQIYNLKDKVFGTKLKTYDQLKKMHLDDSAPSDETRDSVAAKPARDTSKEVDSVVNDDDVVAPPKPASKAAKSSSSATVSSKNESKEEDDFEFEFEDGK